jgi:hypothetical protein
MSGGHPPPPTKFGPGGVQTKPASGTGSPRPAPPPATRFGAVPGQRPVAATTLPVHVAQQKRSTGIAPPAIHWVALTAQSKEASSSRARGKIAPPSPVKHSEPPTVRAKTGPDIPPPPTSIRGHAQPGGTSRAIAPLPAPLARGSGPAAPVQMRGRRDRPPPPLAPLRGAPASAAPGQSSAVERQWMSTNSPMPRPNTAQLRASVVQRADWFLNDDDGGYGSDSSDGDEKPAINTISPEEFRVIRVKAIAAFEAANFQRKHKGYKLLGVHETTNEKAASLVTNGPAADQVGSGHGLGKGRGFYITPIGTKLSVDLDYGECIVAVYMIETAERRGSGGIDNVDQLEKQYVEEFEEPEDQPCYYVMAGGGEIVIPERCFGLVKMAKERSDLNKW